MTQNQNQKPPKPKPRPCAVCRAELNSITDSWDELQPDGGGQIDLVFAYGSSHDEIPVAHYTGIICDKCAATLLPRMNKNEPK